MHGGGGWQRLEGHAPEFVRHLREGYCDVYSVDGDDEAAPMILAPPPKPGPDGTCDMLSECLASEAFWGLGAGGMQLTLVGLLSGAVTPRVGSARGWAQLLSSWSYIQSQLAQGKPMWENT